MAGDKYFYNNSGAITEKASNQTSAGSADAGKIVALNARGQLDQSNISKYLLDGNGAFMYIGDGDILELS